jgi:hypothetical protein
MKSLQFWAAIILTGSVSFAIDFAGVKKQIPTNGDALPLEAFAWQSAAAGQGEEGSDRTVSSSAETVNSGGWGGTGAQAEVIFIVITPPVQHPALPDR